MKNYHFSDYEEIIDKNNNDLIQQLNEKLLQEGNLHAIQVYGDDRKDKKSLQIFKKKLNGNYQVNNYVGVVSFQSDDGEVHNITIGSRFDKFDENEVPHQFLSYMLRHSNRSTAIVFDEIFIQADRSSILQQILLFRFIDLLKKTYKKGVFKQYTVNHYNDSKLKGIIDINQHIKNNMIGNGKIAYRVTERQVDNPINALILQAIRHLKKKYPQTLTSVMNHLPQVKEYISQLKAEIPNYAEQEVLRSTSKQVIHPYYSNIENLRKTARGILCDHGVEIFEQSVSKVNGVLLDINKLWEWFLEETIFNDLLAENLEGIRISNNYKSNILINSKKLPTNGATINPDFTITKSDKPFAVFDAKHRPSWQKYIDEGKKEDIRSDTYQVFAYMKALNSRIGGVIFPYSQSNINREISTRMVSKHDTNSIFLMIPYVVQKKGLMFESLMDKQNKNVQSKIRDEIESKILSEKSMNDCVLSKLRNKIAKDVKDEDLIDIVNRLRDLIT